MHIGIIMDGNRRWAKNMGKSSFYGHNAGFKNAENIVNLSFIKGVKQITLWALSKENLEKRDIDEINGIIKLIDKFVDFLPMFKKHQAKFETIGDISKLPEKTRKILQKMKDETSIFQEKIITIALVYSGQDEIVRATKKIISQNIDPNSLDEKKFRKYLDTYFLSPIDLIIRTGGDFRHSGFTLYDSAYSEYYFSSKFWPEFDEKELNNALNSYSKSDRRFGK
ncbi:di-trans,poly-cis-decaprenylcistransferase [Candidatus Gracilibacteria bacterium]|nr:di-trans,poly-cis-decaprenylcistransferase [Candidatus Gracilibacteria bacterium]